ncbi:Fc.00g046300.m01.CDS01 [Cosmosporella sp. VM-42]
MLVAWAGASGPGNRGAFYTERTSDHWICFAAQPDSPPTVEHPFYLRSIVYPELDVSRVNWWLSTCDRTHKGRCLWEGNKAFSDAFPGLSVLRLIDVVQGCLVETRSLTKYVALSYIWGAVDNFRLTKANRAQLLVPDSINKLFDRLPTTIRDAILLVKKIGLRYLWVDALCLLQNDSKDLQEGVQVMDLVYERSWLAIVAACGHNADAGLPGVQSETRKTTRLTLQVLPGISLGVYTRLDQLIKGTVYNSRAWTFQEQVLCRRAIYFIDNKIFFRCSHADFSESCLDQTRPWLTGTNVASLLPEAVHMSEPLNDYAIMLLYYSRRALTNEGDVLRAMAGIIRRISDKEKTRFLEGIPSVAIDAFLLFTAPKNNLHRRSGFPSYSWAGWRGDIAVDVPFDMEINDWLANETWIIWYKRNPSGITNLVWDPAAGDLGHIHGKASVILKGGGQFKSVVPLNISTLRTLPTEDIAFTVPIPSYPLLQFWTVSVFFKLDETDVFRATSKLVGRDGSHCGDVTLDGYEETTFFDSQEPFEFILISGLSPINALLLEWNGEIAERRGIGTLLHKAIGKGFLPGPRWREIVLG